MSKEEILNYVLVETNKPLIEYIPYVIFALCVILVISCFRKEFIIRKLKSKKEQEV